VRAAILYAQGSPCPTLVLPARALPDEDLPALSRCLESVRGALRPADRDRILKFALVAPDPTGRFDLTYRFVQYLPDHEPSFEFRGSCGHSILAAVVGAAWLGFGPPPLAGRTIDVRVLNNDDHVTCTVARAGDGEFAFTVDFHRLHPPLLGDLLLFGEPVTEIGHPGGPTSVSGVSLGNAYVFVDATTLGCPDPAALFGGGQDLLTALSSIRRGAELRLGWSPGAFPKVAAVMGTTSGIAARAISVPSWHPSLALTGATCLAAATALPGTVPAGLAPPRPAPLTITTPGGDTTVEVATEEDSGDRLSHVTVFGKTVRLIAELELPATEGAVASR
jgi:2-methylaconitate cis-trans-isomerase PrpF